MSWDLDTSSGGGETTAVVTQQLGLAYGKRNRLASRKMSRGKLSSLRSYHIWGQLKKMPLWCDPSYLSRKIEMIMNLFVRNLTMLFPSSEVCIYGGVNAHRIFVFLSLTYFSVLLTCVTNLNEEDEVTSLLTQRQMVGGKLWILSVLRAGDFCLISWC